MSDRIPGWEQRGREVHRLATRLVDELLLTQQTVWTAVPHDLQQEVRYYVASVAHRRGVHIGTAIADGPVPKTYEDWHRPGSGIAVWRKP